MGSRNINFVSLVILVASAFVALTCDSGGAADINVGVAKDPSGDWVIEVSGLTREQIDSIRPVTDQGFIKLWVRGVDHDEVPCLSGQIIFSGLRAYFKPDFPFKSGMSYESEVTVPAGGVIKKSFSFPAKDVQPTNVMTIYPTSDELPENLLKFYVHFSGPMRKGDVYQFIHLRELAEGNGDVIRREIELPFLEIEQEFWSTDSRRLTLLLDPGRIKRGLKPREEMGPIFVAGKKYELAIEGEWPDANGHPLKTMSGFDSGISFSKVFTATRSDQTCPDPAFWKFNVPKSGSYDAFVLNMDEQLDSAMLQRVIEIHGPDGQSIEGEIRLLDNESVWKLIPNSSWEIGRYELHVDNRQEDLCGNSISKLFDVDVFETTEALNLGDETVLAFEIE